MAEPKEPIPDSPGPETETRDRIIATANRLFMEHKYSRVTMEEIAGELGISKKTLYKYFPNKEEILRAAVHRMMHEGAALLDPILNNSNLSFTEKLHGFMSVVARQTMKITPAIVDDISRNAPEIWHEIDTFRQKRFQMMGRLIREGIEQGLLRSDLNEELVVSLYMTMMRGMMIPDKIISEGHGPQDVVRTIATVFFEGMMTDPGRAEYMATLTQPKSQQ